MKEVLLVRGRENVPAVKIFNMLETQLLGKQVTLTLLLAEPFAQEQ